MYADTFPPAVVKAPAAHRSAPFKTRPLWFICFFDSSLGSSGNGGILRRRSLIGVITAVYSNRFPAAVAQKVPILLSLASKTSTTDLVVNSSPLAPSSKVAVIFCDPMKKPLAS